MKVEGFLKLPEMGFNFLMPREAVSLDGRILSGAEERTNFSNQIYNDGRNVVLKRQLVTNVMWFSVT